MPPTTATLTLLALMGVAWAGCVTEDPPLVISVRPVGGGHYVFSTDFEADNYTWSFGDSTSPTYGPTVEHRYDFHNGTVLASLQVTIAGRSEQTQETIVLGSGVNQAPVVQMFMPMDWAVVGEPLTFWLDVQDPDGGAPRAVWSCFKVDTSILYRPHHEAPLAPDSGMSATINAAAPLTAVPVQDLCAGIANGLGPSSLAIRGVFREPGTYRILGSVSDGAHPSVSRFADILVSPQGERPPAMMNWTFEQEHGAGANRSVGLVENGVAHRILLPAPVLSLHGNVTPLASGAEYYLQLHRDGRLLAEGASLQVGDLSAGEYQVTVHHAGLPSEYRLTVEARTDLAKARHEIRK